MKYPDGYTEQQVLEIIERCVGILSGKFRFGYYELEDIKQEARLMALEVIPKFDPKKNKTLDNLIYIHLRNRLVNFKRNNYKRNEPPCIKCPFYDKYLKKSTNQCAAFADKLECDLFSKFTTKNEAREKLAVGAYESKDISNRELITGSCTDYDETSENVSFSELTKLIDEKLDVSLRGDYLRLLAGAPLSKVKKDKVRNEVLKILNFVDEEKKEEIPLW
jgi:hypothetical protein